jgi:hypothetical protein
MAVVLYTVPGIPTKAKCGLPGLTGNPYCVPGILEQDIFSQKGLRKSFNLIDLMFLKFPLKTYGN